MSNKAIEPRMSTLTLNRLNKYRDKVRRLLDPNIPDEPILVILTLPPNAESLDDAEQAFLWDIAMHWKELFGATNDEIASYICRTQLICTFAFHHGDNLVGFYVRVPK